MKSWMLRLCVVGLIIGWRAAPARSARAASSRDLIFKRSTVFKLLTTERQLATYGLDDPEVRAWPATSRCRSGRLVRLDRVGRGGFVHLACLPAESARSIQAKFAQGEDVFRQAPLVVLQEDADRARLRASSAMCSSNGLFDRLIELAEEFHLLGSDHAGGRQRSGAALRRFRGEVSRHSQEAVSPGSPAKCVKRSLGRSSAPFLGLVLSEPRPGGFPSPDRLQLSTFPGRCPQGPGRRCARSCSRRKTSGRML